MAATIEHYNLSHRPAAQDRSDPRNPGFGEHELALILSPRRSLSGWCRRVKVPIEFAAGYCNLLAVTRHNVSGNTDANAAVALLLDELTSHGKWY